MPEITWDATEPLKIPMVIAGSSYTNPMGGFSFEFKRKDIQGDDQFNVNIALNKTCAVSVLPPDADVRDVGSADPSLHTIYGESWCSMMKKLLIATKKYDDDVHDMFVIPCPRMIRFSCKHGMKVRVNIERDVEYAIVALYPNHTKQ